MKEKVICSVCGKEQLVPPSRAKKYKTCSKECMNNRSKLVEVSCEVCNKKQKVYPTRAKRYRTCSRECMGKLFAEKAEITKIELECPVCHKLFRTKLSAKARRNYCSKVCQGKAYRTRYLGAGNPNHKGILMNQAGYLFGVSLKGTKMQLHKEIVMEVLKLSSFPKGVQTHHRDCNKINNNPDNLVLMPLNIHRWMHKQFGNAILWAYCHGEIKKGTLVKWSDNPERADFWLDKSIITQKI